MLVPATSPAQSDSHATATIVVAWPSAPMETRIAFDRPIDSRRAASFIGTAIQFDPHQRSLVRWRSQGSPPIAPPSGTLTVAAAQLDATGRTLTLTTDPHPREAVYLLDAKVSATPRPGGEARSAPSGNPPSLRTTTAYDLTGVSVSWTADQDGVAPAWVGWWPELDPQTSRRMTLNSLEHDRGFSCLNQPGRLTLECLVVLPKGKVVLSLESGSPLEVTLNGEAPGVQGKSRTEFVVESTGEANFLTMTVPTTATVPFTSLHARYRGEQDPTEQALLRDRLLVPWAPLTPASAETSLSLASPPFPLSGGDRLRGEKLFHGDRAKCSGCHKVDGKGGSVGPDLSGVADRRIEELFRDIAEPSATIHPNFNAYTVALKDGRVIVGVVRAVGPDKIRVTDSDAKAAEILRSEVEELRPSGTSIMPVGLVGAIGEQETRDILAYLRSSERARTTSPKSSDQVPRSR